MGSDSLIPIYKRTIFYKTKSGFFILSEILFSSVSETLSLRFWFLVYAYVRIYST